ncbi:hypothetical protein C8R42DRAFT_645824 [Lentinula raphanica]|nr:hypothetical protein C8R42DRAFT_645824 [Lentinula raphanica]
MQSGIPMSGTPNAKWDSHEWDSQCKVEFPVSGTPSQWDSQCKVEFPVSGTPNAKWDSHNERLKVLLSGKVLLVSITDSLCGNPTLGIAHGILTMLGRCLKWNRSAYYPKPTKPTLQGRNNSLFGLSEEEAKVLAKFLLKDEKKGKGRDAGGLKKKKKNEKSIRGSQGSNKFRNDVPALLGSFQRSTAPVPGPSTSSDDSAMVE